ncbi:MAG TPA: hypothetical protein VNX68_19400 [Nitrosopumilaceae archaeon]|nr:hypothetical protein [Nitrosopumilaceae archaeon]
MQKFHTFDTVEITVEGENEKFRGFITLLYPNLDLQKSVDPITGIIHLEGKNDLFRSTRKNGSFGIIHLLDSKNNFIAFKEGTITICRMVLFEKKHRIKDEKYYFL